MKIKLFFVIICSIVFAQCNNPEQSVNKTSDSKAMKDTCCSNDHNMKNDSSETSEITCPKCGHKKLEKLPTDVCVIRYTCEKCKAELTPKEGDCCVFCTYGTHKCPSKQ